MSRTCWRVEGIADEYAFECLVFKFVTARLVDVCIGRASEGPEVGEVGHLVRDHKQWNAVGFC